MDIAPRQPNTGEVGARPGSAGDGVAPPEEAGGERVRLALHGDDATLRWVAQATAPLTGDEFFRSVVRNLAVAFDLRRAMVAECVDVPTTRVRTLAYWFDGGLRPDFEFDLAGTPCEVTVRGGRVWCLAEGLGAKYPGARRLGLDGYLGAPIFDGSGERLIGHVAFETAGAMDPAILDSALFHIFVSRTAAELRRKRAEDVLRGSEEKYRLIVEHQTDVLARYDAGRRLTFVSPSFCRLFGAAESALLGRCWRAPVAEEDAGRFDAAWQALHAPPHEAQFEERAATAQGWRWLAWSCKAVLGTDGAVQAVVAGGRDVTERRRAEEQARQHLQQLARVGRVSAMGEMASAIAHEVNQPLTALRTNAQACLRLLAAGCDAAELAPALERIAAQAERAGGIISRLRAFMARDAGETVPVDPNYLVAEVVDLVRPEAEAGGVRLETALAPALPRVTADCIQVEQVIVNLVRNGIEAIEHADCAARRVAIATHHAGAEIVISVADSGPGVAPDLTERVFEPFFTTKPGGMGIGLAISRSIAQAHGGRLWLAPGEAGGVAFHLALPVGPAATEAWR